MTRYFIEVAYKGTRYNGFQIQENARTIQSELEGAIALIQRHPVSLTGSSRTDAGVHALQNYFHFDAGELHPQLVYKLNAILPGDIVVRRLLPMPEGAHSRFDAIAREYEYHLYTQKNPFLQETALFYPYRLDHDALAETAAYIKEQTNFWAFSKTNTQVKNFRCQIAVSEWVERGEEFLYHIEGNRFLRGMVRLLTATQLKVGRGKLSLDSFKRLFTEEAKCGHSIAATGLYLIQVKYPENYFPR
ncbi:tRNA pseudouridine(38-40) synthase TruA [Flaviaesturariibacter aridisoli]|uniref:tRNA pseudouridine synthase A n=1 Tax=Flaviaesturariibacter aridisoli TaxID=2545761 RepID=A0A4R4DRX2_9BACT|nr:tRNA pseudouridine(38-40) synthase TruA [Flaviaesturariibacter aridisoli]TCZ64288.1 tRNA pseudouridine(38-40) synthase TruA [Flaviaesturariibacter aridisoli]